MGVNAETESRTLMFKFIKSAVNSRVIKFLLVGLLNTLFGYSLYAILVFSGLPYINALTLTTVIGVVFNFFSMGKMVFHGKGGKITFVKFIFVYLIVYIFNAYFLDLLVTKYNISAYVSQGICLIPSICFNWFMLKNWVFKR